MLLVSKALTELLKFLVYFSPNYWKCSLRYLTLLKIIAQLNPLANKSRFY